jgi:two-component system CheB/CheR fusion protein
VGIGASAGGLRALESFFRAMPADTGMGFVVVQHLSPDFKSLMGDLLSRYTSMKIQSAEQDMRIEPNHIYLIPPNTHMTVERGQIKLTDRSHTSGQGLSLPIDIFFESLARDMGDRAVAVVLSGTGSDGTRGIQAVADRDGLVMAQNPESAEFDSMPRNALATGRVNLVLPPNEMANAIQSYITDPDLINRYVTEGSERDSIGLDDYALIFAHLKSKYGIDFAQYKVNTISRRIERRLTALHGISLSDYAARIVSNPEEADLLYHDLLIRVTEFFRNPMVFDLLEKQGLPAIFKNLAAQDEFRVWVAGCATGEEAYSLAILIHEAAEKHKWQGKVTIFATDVHKPSLNFASAGVYPAERLKNVSDQRIFTYFDAVGKDSYQVKPKLRRMVVFAPHNLLTDPPFTRLHLVSCRNLLIYLHNKAQENAIAQFHFSLRLNGLLILGTSEGLGRYQDEFSNLDNHWRIFQKRRDIKLGINPGLMIERPEPLQQRDALVVPMARTLVGIDRHLLTDYDLILDRYAPPGLLVDEQRRVLHYFGEIHRYMESPRGRAEGDVLRLLDPNLSLALSTSLNQAAKTDEPLVTKGIRVQTKEGEEYVDLVVMRLLDTRTMTAHFHIAVQNNRPVLRLPEPDHKEASLLFVEDDTERPSDSDRGDDLRMDKLRQQRILDLEHELQFTRENLQATIEELQTSNEELQATNEELLASNEELQSTNEELQSVNEELFTVNAEFEAKNMELQRLNQDYDNLIRSTDVALVFLDKKLRIRRYTPNIDSFFELRPYDIGRPIDNIAYQLPGQQKLMQDLARIMASESSQESEVTTKDEHTYLQRISPFFDENQRVQGVILMFTDVSAVKHAEAIAQQNERRFRAAIESSLDAVYLFHAVHDPQGHLIDFTLNETNQVGEDRWNLSRSRLLGRSLRTLYRDLHTYEQIFNICAQVMQSGKPAIQEIPVILHDQEHWVRQQVVAVDGGVVVTDSDITDQKRMELRIREERERLELVLRAGELSAWDIDLVTGENRVNDSWFEMLGYVAGEIDPSRWSNHTHPEDVPRFWEAIDRHARSETDSIDLEVRMRHKAGHWIWVQNRGRILEWMQDGSPRRITGTLLDVSKRRQADEVLRQHAWEMERMNEDMARAMQTQDEFMATVSHELRTPLTAIASYTELLLEQAPGKMDEEQLGFLQSISRSSSHLQQLINDILDVSRIDAGQITLHPQWINVNALCRESLDMANGMVNHKHIQAVLQAQNPSSTLYVDSLRLKQVLVNLLSNAVKFTPAYGRIGLRVEEDPANQCMRLVVWDTGIGIKPADQQRIFEPFVQVDSRLSREYSGAGLGLSLVRRLVELHKGSIEVKSQPNKGSEFIVSLPWHPQNTIPSQEEETDTAQAFPASAPALDAADGSSTPQDAQIRLLLIDDDLDNATIIQHYFENRSFRLIYAKDGQSGLDTLQTWQPDLILMDIQMPGLDGLQVIRRIRRMEEPAKASLPIIALTGLAMPGDRKRIIDAGADHYVSKPFSLSKLAQLIREMVAKHAEDGVSG